MVTPDSEHETCSEKASEECFHDGWADATDTRSIDVVRLNEACTSPEMRWITNRLPDLTGKTLLDVGCGLGEASVYFALKGATVTSLDISARMLDRAQELAERNGVAIRAVKVDADATDWGLSERFDFIYMGNLLHHVDIAETLSRAVNSLNPAGVLFTWDPLEYNPIINIYRRIARQVRTPGEHPFRRSDLDLFMRHFDRVETECFWFTTLLIFIYMAVVQRRSPNRERYWKTVVEEGERWRPAYDLLERLDRLILKLIPPLRWLCWNIAIAADRPKTVSGPSEPR